MRCFVSFVAGLCVGILIADFGIERQLVASASGCKFALRAGERCEPIPEARWAPVAVRSMVPLPRSRPL